MLSLPEITLFSIVSGDNPDIMRRVVRVMNYCMSVAKFKRGILMTYLPPDIACKAECVQIPNISFNEGAQILQVKTMAYFELGDYVLHVHDDGFILDPDRWEPEFLNWDYIGAPWHGGLVGNNGFCLLSKKFMKATAKLPFLTGSIHSDNYMCRDHRQTLIGDGVAFAPAEIAIRFSTELYGNDKPSFGFHGKRHSFTKYGVGWELIEKSEAAANK